MEEEMKLGAMQLNEQNLIEDGQNQENLVIESLPLGDNINCVFKCKFNDLDFAVKKMPLSDSTPGKIESHQEDWQTLLAFKCENLVSYHKYFTKESFGYVVMDLCLGSMLDFCNGKICVPVSDREICGYMWDTLRGLEFLHSKTIYHGRLELTNILFWKKRTNSKPIVKISGYIPRYTTDEVSDAVENDLHALGSVLYSIASKDVDNRKQTASINLNDLTCLSKDQRPSALMLINHLLTCSPKLKPKLKPTLVKQLLRHPLFTKNLALAKSLLMDDARITDAEELNKWYNSIANNGSSSIIGFDEDSFNDLTEILLSSNKSSNEMVTRAFEDYPEMYSTFIWDLTMQPGIKETKKFFKANLLGSGSYGIVYGGKWIDEQGVEMPAACKCFKDGGEGESFDKEFAALRQLDHLFVIKWLGICEIESEKCIVMELCEGTLEDYVLGKLSNIPKDSLSDKIILGQVTLGLAYIHSKGMIHKDLKPANVLIWRSPSPESTMVLAKIADFGFAKQLKVGKEEFSETDHPGTKSCMAPELFVKYGEKAPATFDSDVYALGITIAFTVLKGTHPYGKDRELRPILMRSGCDPILLGELEWDVTHLILHLTKNEPKQRPRIATVIYHPYFALTNENTKAHFESRINHYLKLFDDSSEIYQKVFGQKNVELWIEMIKLQKENEENKNTVRALEKMNDQLIQEALLHINQCGGNYSKYKNAIASANENKSTQYQRRYYTDYARDLISKAPNFSVCYLWYVLSDRTYYLPSIITTDDKPSVNRVMEYIKMTEYVFGFLYFEKSEDKMELWNQSSLLLKRADLSDEAVFGLMSGLPRLATPGEVFLNLFDKLKNVNSYYKKEETTALIWVLADIWWSDFSLVSHLLEIGADPNIPGEYQTSPLHLAAMNETSSGPKMLKALLDAGGNPNAVNENKRTPVHSATMNESSLALELLELLLEKNGNIHANDKHNHTPVHLAASNKSASGSKILECLLRNGGNPKSENVNQTTPLHIVAMNEYSSAPEMLKLLLKEGANPNARNLSGKTPISRIAENKSNFAPEMLKLILLEKDLNVNCTDEDGNTPLHFAAMNVSIFAPELVKLLLESKGTDPNATNKRRQTPVHFAAKNQSSGVVYILELLLKEGGKRNSLDEDNNTPAYFAAKNESSFGPEMLKLLEL